MSHVTGCTCADEGRCLTCHCSPAEPTPAEAFATVRELLSVLSVEKIDGVGKFYAARDAIALLERRIQDSPTLAVLAEAFCSEVENAKFSREARKSGGQTTGVVSPFEHVQPSVASNLERWVRDFREAMRPHSPCVCSNPDAGDCPTHPGSR